MSKMRETSVSFLSLVREIETRNPGGRPQSISRKDLISLYNLNFEQNGKFSEVLDLLFFHGLMDADSKANHQFAGYFVTDFGVRFLRDPSKFPFLDDADASAIQRQIDSTDWTGLGKRIGPEQSIEIRKISKSLLSAIIQSDADIQTRTDACKRVEAVLLLLEAPNVPWREVVSLLNHPTVTAFLATLNLIQFIIGMAS